MAAAVTTSLLLALLSPGLAAEDVASTDAAPHSDGDTATGADGGHGSSHEAGPHAANAILFLFVALTVGILLRRAVTGFIIPYTGLLVVRPPLQ